VLRRPAAWLLAHPWTVAAFLSTLLALAVALGMALAPRATYDGFLWPHLVGSAVADVRQWPAACLAPDGAITRGALVAGEPACVGVEGVAAAAGYTPVAELLVAATGLVSLAIVYVGFVRRFDVALDGPFIVAYAPTFLFGITMRVVEDAGGFCRPGTLAPGGCESGLFAFLWIAPFAYYQLAWLFFGPIGVGLFLARRRARGARWQTRAFAVALAAEVALLALVFLLAQPDVVAPLVTVGVAGLLVGAAAGLAAYARLARRAASDGGVRPALFALTMPPLAAALALVATDALGAGWTPPGLAAANPVPAATVLVLAVLATAGVGLAVRRWGGPLLARVADPVNLAIVFGQAWDGVATWISVSDPFGQMSGQLYLEKHPVSEAILLAGGDGILFPIAKVAVAVALVLVVERELARSATTPNAANAVGFLRILLLALGLVPGLRNTLRLALGV